MSPTREHSVSIDAIRIGARFRKDLGDLDQLAASIKDLGLLHPIVVTSNHQLIAGQRRLEAGKRLGWTDIPVHVVDLDQLVRGQYAENVERLDFAPTEKVAISEALKPMLVAAAAKRQRAGQRPSGNLPEGETGQGRDLAAKHVRMSGRTLEKATAVVKAAEREPEKFAAVAEQMDRTKKVDAAYQKVRRDTASRPKRPTAASQTEGLGKKVVSLSAVSHRPPKVDTVAALDTGPAALRPGLYTIHDTTMTLAKRHPADRAFLGDWLDALATVVRTM